MTRSLRIILLGLMAIGVLTGCPSLSKLDEPLPRVAWSDTEQARQILSARQDAIVNVQAQCKIKFAPADQSQKTQTLDGAVVFDDQGNVRLRSYKLGQMVFDLTLNDTGVWVTVNKEFKEQADDARQGLAKLADALPALLRGPDFGQAQLRGSANADSLRASWPNMQASIDARTLSPTRFVFTGEAAESIRTLDTRYSDYDNGIWLREITAEGGFGEITLTFRNVELNGELNPRAFRQPRRAVNANDLETASP